ncbi:MAG: TOBE domain-containing protein [Chloroflexi bacterium]|nr:TOBE domain-containing protein [Chloroflexota bacterium]
MISARNQLEGTVQSVKLGNVMAKVIVAVGNNEIAAAITRTSAEKLNLKVGDKVTTVIKPTKAMIAKD